MTKPTVFNYQDYVALEAEILDLTEKNDRLKEKVANLGIRCRIAEEALTESQKNLLNLAMDHNLLQLTINRTWIPVCEKLPEIDVPVLIGWSDGQITVGTYAGNRTFTGQDWPTAKNAQVTVIAWMPLPEPYKEDVND